MSYDFSSAGEVDKSIQTELVSGTVTTRHLDQLQVFVLKLTLGYRADSRIWMLAKIEPILCVPKKKITIRLICCLDLLFVIVYDLNRLQQHLHSTEVFSNFLFNCFEIAFHYPGYTQHEVL